WAIGLNEFAECAETEFDGGIFHNATTSRPLPEESHRSGCGGPDAGQSIRDAESPDSVLIEKIFENPCWRRLMKPWAVALSLLAVCGNVFAETMVWQPGTGHTQMAIWPATPPDARPMPGPEDVTTGKSLIAGKHVVAVRNVSQPTMTVYAPTARNTG